MLAKSNIIEYNMKMKVSVKKRFRQIKRNLYKRALYNKILQQQNGKCAICGIEPHENGYNFYIDHCHQTNNIRGVLCPKCNGGLGFFGDSIEILNEAIKYLTNKGSIKPIIDKTEKLQFISLVKMVRMKYPYSDD